MDLYVILRRDPWRAPEDLQVAAESLGVRPLAMATVLGTL